MRGSTLRLNTPLSEENTPAASFEAASTLTPDKFHIHSEHFSFFSFSVLTRSVNTSCLPKLSKAHHGHSLSITGTPHLHKYAVFSLRAAPEFHELINTYSHPSNLQLHPLHLCLLHDYTKKGLSYQDDEARSIHLC